MRAQARDALGALRDTVGAVGNLDQLLRSTRVAPKALSSVLPDVAATLPALEQELDVAHAVLREKFDPVAVAQLFAFFQTQTTMLHRAIDDAMTKQRSMNASSRLGLEREVSQIQQQLIGGLPLLEVMTEVAFGSILSLDLHELLVLLRIGDQSHGLRGRSLEVGLEPGSVPLTLMSSPRSALTLIALGAALSNEVCKLSRLTIGLHRDTATLQESPTRAPLPIGTRARLVLEARAPEAPAFRLVVPPVVAPTEACLSAVARAMNITLVREKDRVAMTWIEPAVR